ncbi:MAG TPA: hypothetical protein VI893_03590 [Thermoplasmata archaeon]|nr:hypothetical protein [Thermoplasmata archaeon]
MAKIREHSTDRSGFGRERILRRLLVPGTTRGKGKTLYRIAKEAGVAYGWSHRILKDLERRGAFKQSTLVDPAEAFTYWLEHHRAPMFRDYHVPDPALIIGKAALEYAATTYAADHVTTQYLFPKRWDLYIRAEDAREWHKAITKVGFVGEGNLRLLRHDPDVLITGGIRRDLMVVNVPQLILDLLFEGGPCVEAAQYMIERSYHAKTAI